MTPTLTVCMTVNRRTVGDLSAVIDSLMPQSFDQLVVVLDRPEKSLADWVRTRLAGDARSSTVEIAGPPGWLCPARAWNVGFDRVRSDLIYCISSDVIQAEGNVEQARAMLATEEAVVHGSCECSCGPQGREVNWTDGSAGNLFGNARHPRPLGFIWAAPMGVVRQIGGFDEGFMRGFWFDDNDFFARLWRTRLPFIFTDRIKGVHQHHERPDLSQERIQLNAEYFASKWGPPGPDLFVPRREFYRPDTTRWQHE